MCEFCTKHGEGKKWYLQMRNYSDELLHEELSRECAGIVDAATRLDWNRRFMEQFVIPAVPALSSSSARSWSAESRRDTGSLGRDELVARRKAEHFGQVLPIEDVERVLEMADSITRMPCGCRFLTTGKTDRRYCFGLGIDRLGILGDYPDAASSLEVLSREEAKRVFREYDREGLIHSVWTGVTPFVCGLCNCDSDCGAYSGYIEMRGAPDFFRAEYVCEVDWDACTGCKSCISQCQFGAQFFSSTLAKVHIDPTRCFGCGVCRAACPNDAIRLVPRSTSPQAADLWLEAPGAASAR
jgi:NAD-dependent dihydropyrimidine dehydrogenase PreA subunit